MASMFQPATRKKLRLRMALDGPAKSGKSYTALRFAFALGAKVAAIDTESGSLSKYQGEAPDGVPFDFDVRELASFSPTEYTAAIEEAGRCGYDILIIDSLSHAWAGKDGALEIKDRAGGNSFTAWKDVTPMHNRMVDAILTSPCHVIATMRSKMEYVLEEEVSKSGSKVMVPRKVGLAPIQRSGMEYEFDILGSLDPSHVLKIIGGSRCRAVENAIVSKPTADFMRPIIDWLNRGVDAAPVSLPKRVGAEQLERLYELQRKLKLNEARVRAALAKYGANAFADLMAGDADSVEEAMRGKLATNGNGARSATPGEPVTSTPPVPPVDAPAPREADDAPQRPEPQTA